MIGEILNALTNLAILCCFLYLIYVLLHDAVERVRMPKHFGCGSRWRVRRYAYYWDVPLYRCSRCEPNPVSEEATFFVATEDDAERLRDHLLADEAEEPLTVHSMWKNITASPRTQR